MWWLPIDERFRRQYTEQDNGCWTWNTPRANGYVQFKVGGVNTLVHRWAYERFVGPIPAGYEIDHLCRNRGCVNPAHLEPVTPRENTLRSGGITALNARKTHCTHGHAFDEENTYITPKGRRSCRACNRKYVKRYRAAMSHARIVGGQT